MKPLPPITSIKDERIVQARALSTAAARRETGQILLEGMQVIEWALAADLTISYALIHNKITDHALLKPLQQQGIACFAVSEGILKKVTGTRYLIPWVGVARSKTGSNARPADFVIVLDGVQDHGNIGTIARTARGFGLSEIISTRPELDLFYRKTIEASRGKVFEMRLRRFESGLAALDYLKAQGYQIVATSPHASGPQATAVLEQKPLALVVGNETEGVSPDVLAHADLVVQIPMSRQVESLNVGVATGISVYELKLKLVIAMLTQYIRTQLGREVNVAGKLIQMALDKELQTQSAFTSTQIILLMILKCDETMTLEQVGQDTATFGDEQQRLLQPLLEGGYIRPVDDTSIQLMEKGEQLLGQLWGIFEATEDKILQGFSEQEQQQLIDYLQRLQKNCEALINT